MKRNDPLSLKNVTYRYYRFKKNRVKLFAIGIDSLLTPNFVKLET